MAHPFLISQQKLIVIARNAFRPTKQSPSLQGHRVAPDCLYDPLMVLRSEIVIVAEPFLFASFSFVNNGGIVDNTSPCQYNVFDFLTWPYEKIRQTAEALDCRDIESP